MKLDKKLKNIQVQFVGKYDWIKLKDLIILKLQECDSEKELAELLKVILGSFFTDAIAIDEARKTLKLNPLSEREKNKIDKRK